MDLADLGLLDKMPNAGVRVEQPNVGACVPPAPSAGGPWVGGNASAGGRLGVVYAYEA